MRLSCASRNDTDDFFPMFLIERMHDEQNRTRPYGPNRYPSLLIFKSEVTLRKSIGIIENEHGRFKANIVLAKVLSILLLIPFKSHSWSRPGQNIISICDCQYICTYTDCMRDESEPTISRI